MSKTCRICLKKSSNTYSLKEPTNDVENMDKNCKSMSFCEMYNYCTKLGAKVNDEYPQALCFSCASNLITSYQTISTAIESEKKLLQLFVSEVDDKDDIHGELKLDWPSNDSINLPEEMSHKHKSDEYDDDVHQDYEYLEEIDEHPLGYEEVAQNDKYSQKLILIEPLGNNSLNSFENPSTVKLLKIETPLDNEQIFNCSICYQTFISHIDLKFHMKNNHSSVEKVEVTILDENKIPIKSKTVLNSEYHSDENEEEVEEELLEISSIDNNDPLPEDDCSNKIQEDYNSSNNSESSSKNFNFECRICKLQFTSKPSLCKHMNRVHNDIESEKNRCEICGKRARNLVNHKKVHHSIPILCEICNKELSSQKILKIHMRTHNKSLEKTIPCPKCGKLFPSTINLKYHLQTHDLNRERKFECELCGKKFFNKSFYKSHLITHTKQEFPCHICGKVLSRKLSLANHIKLHVGGDVKCDQCDKTFTTQANLQIHMRFHTKDFPFVCEICGRRFPMRGHLTYHMDKHKGVFFNCPVCDKPFTSRACLREHSFVHIGMPIECNLCGKGFPNKYRFKYHLKKAHKLLNPNLESLDTVHIGKFAGTKTIMQEELEENMD